MEINTLSYEDALKELEVILTDLEKDENTLDESLTMFKKAMKLYDHCNDILSKTEGEIKILLDKDSSLEEVDFIREEDEYY